MDGCMSPTSYTPAQNNILIISRQTQGLYVSVPVRTMPIKDGVKVSKANPCLSSANRPRSMILASNTVENPALRDKSDSLKPLKSPAIAPHFPGIGECGAFHWLER